MKVAIVEPHYHASYLHAVISIAEKCGIESDVFTLHTVWNEAKLFFSTPYKYPITISNSIKELFKVVKKKDEKFDCIFFNTLQVLEWENLVRLAYHEFKCPIVLTIHNPIYWFQHPGYPIWRPRATLRLHCKNRILKVSDGIIFLGEEMIKYARANGYSKPIGVLPYGVFDNYTENTIEKDERIVFAVTGSINENRDYNSLLNVFERVFLRYGDTVSLSLLGGVQNEYGKSIISRCRSMIKNHSDIFYYTENFVSEQVLQTELPKADYMIVPLSVGKFRDGLKVSGTVYDAIRYKIPFLIPEFYNLPSHINGGFLTYKSERELENLIEKCIHRNFELSKSLKLEADRNVVNYRPESWKQAFESFLYSIIK